MWFPKKFLHLLISYIIGFGLIRTVHTEAVSKYVDNNTSIVKPVPYLVMVGRNNIFHCGGTLVASRFVVSAAHCVQNPNPKEFVVIGGTAYLQRPGVTRYVDRIYLPVPASNMDVTVLRLSEPMIGDHIAPIALCKAPVPDDATVQVSGWGITNEKEPHLSNKVHTIEVKTIPFKTCSEAYKNRHVMTRSMLCAAVPGKLDACSGDSGGPLVYNNQFCGIVSFGVGCWRVKYPGVYTNVFVVAPFINEAMKEGSS